MVDLPRVPRRLVTTEAPRSSLTARDIAAPYASLARGLGEIGDAAQDVAAYHAEDAGARSVTTDADGNIAVERAPVVGKAAAPYDRAIRVAAVTRQDALSDQALIDLRKEFRDDPEGFRKAAEAFRDKTVGDFNVGPAASVALRRQIDNRITQTYSGLLAEHQNIEIRKANAAIDARITTMSDEAETLARRNGINGPDGQPTPEFTERMQNVRTLLDEKVKNPLLAYPKEKADQFMDELTTRVQGAAILEQTERVYQERGYEAAREYLRGSTRELDGKVKQVDKIERAGLSWLNTENRATAGERYAVGRDWQAMKPTVANADRASVLALRDHALAVGNHRTASDIDANVAAIDLLKGIRGLPLTDQVRILATGDYDARLTQRESGGNPAAVNQLGYAGLYQFGAPRLADLGVYTPGSGENLAGWSKTPQSAPGKWSGTFKIPGFENVKTLKDFLANPDAQRAVNTLHIKRTDEEIDRLGLNSYVGQTIGGVPITQDSIRAMVHLGGAGGAQRFLTSGGRDNPADANGTRLSEYASLGSGDLRQSRAGSIALGMLQKDLRQDLTHKIGVMQTQINKTEFPPLDQIGALGAQVALLGTEEQKRQVATMAAQAQYGRAFQNLSPPERAQVIASAEARHQAGASEYETALRNTLKTADKNITEAYQKDRYEAYYRFGDGKVLPVIDFKDPQLAAAVIGQKVNQQHTINADQGLEPGSVLRPVEADALSKVLTQGDPKLAAAALGALNGIVHQDISRATFTSEPVVNAITGMANSYDPERMALGMAQLDKISRDDPQGFQRAYSGETKKRLAAYLSRKDSRSDAEQAKIFSEADDPRNAAARKELGRDADEELKQINSKDVATSINDRWFGNPKDFENEMQAAALKAEFSTYYRDLRTRYGVPADKAKEQSVQAMKKLWGESQVGGHFMRLPPENYYPEVNGSKAWMSEQIQADITAARGPVSADDDPGLGAPPVWQYKLVSDQETEADLSAGRPPSYVVIVQDPRAGADPLVGANGLPQRYRFDATQYQAAAERRFVERDQATKALLPGFNMEPAPTTPEQELAALDRRQESLEKSGLGGAFKDAQMARIAEQRADIQRRRAARN